ncbi:MAG: hypothetical protein ACREA0_19895, partial [bacterium]
FALLGEVNLNVLDDRRRAAKEIAMAIGVVGSVLLAGWGMAAGAAGGLLKVGDTLGGPVASEVAAQLTEALEKRLVAGDVTTANRFVEAINSTLDTIMVIGLYNQTDNHGRHPIRDRMFNLGMHRPPKQFLDQNGNLVLPVPLTPEARGALDDWLMPAVEARNPLYEVASAWVDAQGGLGATVTKELVDALYDREASV